MSELVEKIYSILTKKRYCKDKHVKEKEVKQKIDFFVSTNSPIQLVGFWGVGPKSSANWADKESCVFLDRINKEIANFYPPAIEFTFIFAIEHGTHNGISKDTMESYINDIKKLFHQNSFHYLYLGALWDKYNISFEKIDELFQEQTSGWWEKIPVHEKLESQAKKHNHRLTAKEAAQKYVIMRNLEKEMLEKEFATAIFHTYSGSEFDSILPNLPTLHLYSYKKWQSNAPWFITKNQEAG